MGCRRLGRGALEGLQRREMVEGAERGLLRCQALMSNFFWCRGLCLPGELLSPTFTADLNRACGSLSL